MVKRRQKALGFCLCHRRLGAEALEARTLLSVTLMQSAVSACVETHSAAHQQTLADLPVAAQHAVLSAIGQDQSANGANGQVTADPYPQEAELTASDGTPQDEFGCSVSISGNTLVVGEPFWPYDASIANDAPGAAYVFKQSGSTWVHVAKLTASDGAAGDYFGISVSISGNTVVVGAQYADVVGAAYIFTEPAAGWANMTQTAELTASDSSVNDGFGSSVSINGNTVVVGAPGATVAGNNYVGAAYVFAKPTSGWASTTQTAKLIASDGSVLGGDAFGYSVSISGSTVVVGAPNATVDDNTYQGTAYVFTEPASGWANMTQTAKLTAPDGHANGEFGASVSISGNTVVVGADNPYYLNTRGAAYLFSEPFSG